MTTEPLGSDEMQHRMRVLSRRYGAADGP
jgi:hypothetical protein